MLRLALFIFIPHSSAMFIKTCMLSFVSLNDCINIIPSAKNNATILHMFVFTPLRLSYSFSVMQYVITGACPGIRKGGGPKIF